MFFHPLVLVMMMLFVVSVIVLFFMVQVGIVSYAFDKIGIPSEAMFSLLLLSWVGSWVNIPLARFPTAHPVVEGGVIRVFGQQYVIPQWSQRRHIVLAVNVGGAIVPTCLSLYLLTQTFAPLRVVVASAAVTLLTSWGRGLWPVSGLSCPCSCHLSAPLWQPPPATASAEGHQLNGAPSCWCRSRHRWPPMSLGPWAHSLAATCCMCARVTRLGAPVASIGGAGTFDGVFLTGIIAVLLA